MLIEFTTVNEYFSFYSAQYTALLKKKDFAEVDRGFSRSSVEKIPQGVIFEHTRGLEYVRK